MTLHAVSSLKRQLDKYLTEDDSWVDPSSRAMLEFAYNQVEMAEEFSKRVPFRSNAIRRPAVDIHDAIRRLKGALKSESRSEGIENLEKEIHFFTQTMHKLEEDLENAGQLYSSLPGREEDEAVSDGDKPNMVGFSDHYNHLKQMLTDTSTTIFQVVSLCGMPGIGKTTLAREIFEDPDIVERFDCRVWVRVGRKCGFKEVPRRILVELSPHPVEEDADVVGRLNEILKGKRYLIVLDDVWDKHMAKFLKYPVYSSRRGNLLRYPYPFRDELNETRILVISRMQQVNELNTFEGGIRAMRLMNNEESWDLLHEIVFAEESCPFNLERIGKKIAEKCEGLPLMIVTVANLLSKEDKTTEYWNEVATQKRHQLFKVAYDEIMKVLLPSYKLLPPSLQMCFLFIGMFPLYYEISRSRLVNLWVSDGFLEQDHETLTDKTAIVLLEELVSNNIVMIKTTVNSSLLSVGLKQIKTCRLHSSLWHLSSREARSSKFSHVLDSFDDGFGEDIESQCRLSFYNNILFAIKDVHESVEDNCASTAQSLFCFGPYSQYQVPLCFGLRLLNKLDALTIRFYEFPIEVLQLIELRYLALTLNGNLPPAISQLSKVEFLIVQPHQSIKSYEESSYLPKEIWNMKDLRHLQVTEKALPNPCGASLESLSTLLGASPDSCTVDVFRAIPNLNKLGIQVELSHDSSDGEPFTCLSHVSHLQRLSSAKCVVVNPNGIPSFAPLSLFPSGLTKLTLNGLGYTWEEMSKIGSLESLKMLKLRNHAFRGPEWDIGEMQFPNLDSLVIEDTDLAIWRIGHENLLISRLILKHCYDLEEIHGEFGSYLVKIEMVDCNPLGAQQIKKLASSLANVIVSCSWHDKKPKA